MVYGVDHIYFLTSFQEIFPLPNRRIEGLVNLEKYLNKVCNDQLNWDISVIVLIFIEELWLLIKSNQIFHYTRCITPKRVTSLRGPSSRYCTRATQLFSKKWCNGDKVLATLCSIYPSPNLNLRPSAPETNAFSLDQLKGIDWNVSLNIYASIFAPIYTDCWSLFLLFFGF